MVADITVELSLLDLLPSVCVRVSEHTYLPELLYTWLL